MFGYNIRLVVHVGQPAPRIASGVGGNGAEAWWWRKCSCLTAIGDGPFQPHVLPAGQVAPEGSVIPQFAVG